MHRSLVLFLSLMTFGMTVPMAVPTAVRASGSSMYGKGGFGIMCLLCVDVVEQAKDAVKDPELQKSVQDGFKNGVCALFPSYVGTKCETRVKVYAPVVFDLITQSLDSKSFCVDIALCADQPAPTPPPVNKHPAVGMLQSAVLLSSLSLSKPWSSGSNLNCEICMFIVHEALEGLTSNTTEDKVLSVVDRVCQALPREAQKPCWSFLRDFLTTVFRMAADDLIHPQQVCASFNFCPATDETRNAVGDDRSLRFQPKLSM